MIELSACRVAVFDLDGTLIDANNKVLDGILEGIEHLHSKKLKLYLASGRNVHSMRTIIPQLDFLQHFEPVIICNDGNVLYNQQTHEVKIINSINDSILKAILAELDGKADFVIENNSRFYASSKGAATKLFFIYIN
ncbi:HAD family hydrolase [Paenibacillus sp. YYML68]|uniref:HAD family hydrolase n=1 Tax=Paenibacillus sp. YYML68 TaxID=2909250 RepID=UPI0024936857|nr:HAD hydrolase family protein [Paenibacillus sp. YYML68]